MPSEQSVYASPYQRHWTWRSTTIKRGASTVSKPISIAMRSPQTLPSRSGIQRAMASFKDPTQPRLDAYMRLLAQQLFSKSEASKFKQAVQDYRTSQSLPKLCHDLKDVVNSDDKMVILVEFSSRLPKLLRDDFNKLCSLYFENYTDVMNSLRPGNLKKESSKVIAQDSTGTLRVLRKGNQKSLIVNPHSDDYLFREANKTINGVLPNVMDPETSVKDKNTESPQNHLILSKEQSCTTAIESVKSIHGSLNDKQDENNNLLSNKYNQHMQYKYICGVEEDDSQSSHTTSSTRARREGVVRRVYLERMTGSSLGLTVKRGKGAGASVEILDIEPQGQADVNGLKAGDVILGVNGHDFQVIDHDEAVSILRYSSNLQMKVLTYSTFGDLVDVVFKTIEKDIRIRVGEDGVFGFCLAGGVEVDSHAVVSDVFACSVAEKAGLLTGDRVLSILGAETDGLTHKQIVNLAMSSKVINMRVSRPVQISGPKPQVTNEFYRNGIEAVKHGHKNNRTRVPSSPVITRSFNMYNGATNRISKSSIITKDPNQVTRLCRKEKFDPEVYSSFRNNARHDNVINVSNTSSGSNSAMKTNHVTQKDHRVTSFTEELNDHAEKNNVSQKGTVLCTEHSNGVAVVYVDRDCGDDDVAHKTISGNLNIPINGSDDKDRSFRRYKKKNVIHGYQTTHPGNEQLYSLYTHTAKKPLNKLHASTANHQSSSFRSRPEVQAAMMRGKEKKERGIRKTEQIRYYSRDSEWTI